jgi:hypothetical protein
MQIDLFGGISMLVMTAKVDKKKIAIILGAIVAVIVVIAVLFSGGDSTATIGANAVIGNDDRVQFLTGFGWEVVTSPAETSQVRIPANSSEVFDRYNALQKSMGYDLAPYQGKTVMRYVYKIKNYPGATEPVYATILISSNQVIGGDITDTSATGVVQGFEKLTIDK